MTFPWNPRIAILSSCLCTLLLLGCGDDDGATNDNLNLNDNLNDNTNDNANDNANQNTNDDITPYTGNLDDLNGYYEMTSVTLRPSAVDIEVTREPTGLSLPEIVGTCYIRGHGEVLATSATGGALDLAWVVIGDDSFSGYLPWKYGKDLWSATWEQAESKLVLDASDLTVVYLLGYDNDEITLLRDDTDPRGNTTDVPVRFEMTAAPRPVTGIAGTYDLSIYRSAGYRTYELYPDCSPLDPEFYLLGTHGFVNGTISIEDTGWFTRQEVITSYDSSDCSGSPVDFYEIDVPYYFEIDTTNDTLQWYFKSRTSSFNVTATASYTLDGTTLTTTVTDHYSNRPEGNYSYMDGFVCTVAP